MRRLLSLTLAGVGLFAPAVYAQLPGLVSTPLAGGGQSWSLPVQTLVFITSLTFIPAILLMMTSFTESSSSLVCCAMRWAPRPRRLTGTAGSGAVFNLFHYVAGYRQDLYRRIPAV